MNPTLVRPRSEAELVDVLRAAMRDRRSVVPVGFGSKLAWCRPPDPVHLMLSTRELSGVVAYEPADGTITARAGTSMAELADVARAGGNHLTPLVPRPESATLGGVLAAGQSGLDRTRHGPVRNHVLGMRVALADGTIAKSGGRLVKNVTGYDMHRLYCGSHGTLCVILEATLRLFPLPERQVVVRSESMSLPAAVECAGALSRTAVRLLALRVTIDDGRVELSAVLSGAADVVDWELGVVRSIVPAFGTSTAPIDALRDRELEDGTWPHFHMSMRPSQLAIELPSLLERIHAHELTARVVTDPLIATVDVHLRPAHVDTEVVAVFVRELRGRGLRVELRRGPCAANEALDPFGDPTSAIEWMRRLKDSLDPSGVFARGRFHGGI